MVVLRTFGVFNNANDLPTLCSRLLPRGALQVQQSPCFSYPDIGDVVVLGQRRQEGIMGFIRVALAKSPPKPILCIKAH